VQVTVFALDVVGGLAAAERLHDPGKDLVQPKFKWHLLANFEQNLEGDHFHLRVETGGVQGSNPLHHYHTGEFIVAFEWQVILTGQKSELFGDEHFLLLILFDCVVFLE